MPEALALHRGNGDWGGETMVPAHLDAGYSGLV